MTKIWVEPRKLKYRFDIRLQVAHRRKTPEWTLSQLMKVLASLRTNKSRDASGLIYELFKPGVAGEDVIHSLLMLINMMKKECQIPDFMKTVQITSIYKNKGSKADLSNERGIFNVNKVRSIVDKLIYKDTYEFIDSEMSDSNVGGRRGRNVRDNLFVAYSVINYATNNKLETDVTSYDLKQAFDSLWEKEIMNDLWDVKVQDDKFALIYEMNKECVVTVKTPVGETKPFTLNEIEMQGSVLAPLKCSVQTDTVGRYSYLNNKKYTFVYKNSVFIPPLWMIDDCITFALCGYKSIMMNELINSNIAMKKLQLSEDKCKNIHMGIKYDSCCDLKVRDSKHKNT